MDLSLFLTIVDRVGAPMAMLLALGWLAYVVVRGPVTRLAELAGGAFAGLCKAGVEYLTQATERLNSLPGHVSLEAERTRSHVTEECSHTREHVSEEVGRLRDREAPVGPEKEGAR